MKILVISHEYPPIGGGGANACIHLSREFTKAGHEVTIITANYKDLPDVSNEGGVLVYRLHSKRKHADHSSFMEMLSFIQKAYPVSCKLQKENHFDICLTFFGIPSGVIGYLLKKRYKLPYLIRFGGGDVPGAQRRFDKVYKLLSPAIKTIWKSADFRVANSDGLRKIAYRFCERYPFEVIHNGVDAQLFHPCEVERVGNDSVFRMLSVSRLVEVKGLQYLIPQLKYVSENTERKIHFTIVGEGPLKEDLHKLADENGLTDIVEFVGHKEMADLVSFYQRADLFLLSSNFEGMPNVVLEAMACGLPVLMTPCSGSTELINGNGYILKVDEFGKKILEVVKDDELLKKFGEKSRQLIMNNFEWSVAGGRYLELISRTVKSNSL